MAILEEEVGNILTKHGITMAVAESCTGGLISHRITNVPGSSNYFKCCVVAYSSEAKQKVLRVPAAVIKTNGDVSAQTAKAMAQGVKTLSRTDIGLSVTGIAGPGGRPGKPVGLVYIAIAHKKDVISKECRFQGTRHEIKDQAADTALSLVKDFLLKNF